MQTFSYVFLRSLCRVSSSNFSYRVIKKPSGFQEKNFVKSQKGIYYALLDLNCRLWVWILDESSDDQVEWKLRHDSGWGPAFPCLSSHSGPWILSNINFDDESEDEEEDQGEQEFEWNSDDDSFILPTDARVEECHAFSRFRIVAFHPYKEIIFFDRSSSRALAYHLSSSKLEDLGNCCQQISSILLSTWEVVLYTRHAGWMSCQTKSGKPKITMSRVEVILWTKHIFFSSVRLCYYCMRYQFVCS